MSFLESVYQPRLTIPRHAHDYPVWVLVLEGGTDVTSAIGTIHCAADTVRTVPAGQYHSNAFGPAPSRSFLVEIRALVPEHVRACDNALKNETYHPAGGRVAWYMRRIYEEFCASDAAASLAMEGLFLELAALLARMPSRKDGVVPNWLGRVRDAIDADMKGELRVGDLGRIAGVHPVHLARQFRAHFGCSPSEYLRARRISRATEQMRRTDRPLSAIAFETGFSDQSHFSREFRRATGMTPAEYRRIRHR